jgi:hypothetical protein
MSEVVRSPRRPQDDTRAADLRSLRCRAPDVTLAAPRMSQNYKESLNLPKTDFPMKANLATREPEMLKKWDDAGLYEQIQAARADAELFVLPRRRFDDDRFCDPAPAAIVLPDCAR